MGVVHMASEFCVCVCVRKERVGGWVGVVNVRFKCVCVVQLSVSKKLS